MFQIFAFSLSMTRASISKLLDWNIVFRLLEKLLDIPAKDSCDDTTASSTKESITWVSTAGAGLPVDGKRWLWVTGWSVKLVMVEHSMVEYHWWWSTREPLRHHIRYFCDELIHKFGGQQGCWGLIDIGGLARHPLFSFGWLGWLFGSMFLRWHWYWIINWHILHRDSSFVCWRSSDPSRHNRTRWRKDYTPGR